MARVAILLVIFAFAFLNSAGAQQATTVLPEVGFISSAGSPASPSPLFDAFQRGLRDLGYADSKNVNIVHRYAEGRLDLMPAFVHEFVQQKVNVIVAVNNVVIRAAKKATNTIPIVMLSSVDPVEAGYVASFAHPGGNITGLTTITRDLSAKRIELLKEVVQKSSRIGILWDADGPGPKVAFKEYEAAARSFKLALRSLDVRGPHPDFDGAFQAAKSAQIDALVIVGNPLMSQHAAKVFELSKKNRIPTFTEEGRYTNAGGLISYGASLADVYRRAAEYVVEILKGANAGNLPVKLPSKFEMFINLKTAKEIGVVIPQHILVQADKVIK